MLITEAVKTAPVSTGPGRIRIRLIDAGQGSSGYYPPEVLEAAAKDRVFPAGTEIHFDHQTVEEYERRPEGSTKDLIGVTTEDAVYNPTTQALEAEAKIYSPYRVLVAEMKDDVGMSIRASADAQDTQGGRFITRLLEGKSVDVVTKAGRGGKIIEVIESARASRRWVEPKAGGEEHIPLVDSGNRDMPMPDLMKDMAGRLLSSESAHPVAEAAARDRRTQLQRALFESHRDQDGRPTAWLTDFDDANRIAWYEAHPSYRETVWQDTYTVADDDLSVTLTGAPIEVRPVTTYVPVTPTPIDAPVPSAGQATSTQETQMPQIEESRLAELHAAESRVATLETDLAEATQRADKADKDKAAVEAAAARDTRIGEALAGLDRPDVWKARVTEALRGTAGDLTDEVIEAAKTREDDYVKAINPNTDRLHGFGHTQTQESTREIVNPWGRKVQIGA